MPDLFGPDSTGAAGYDAPPPSPDPVCEVCGAPIEWSGRGRRPKYCADHKSKSSSSSSSRSSQAVSERELNTACESLHQLYDMMVFPMTALSPAAGQAWLAQIEALDARNRAILANNRQLVRKINSAGEKSGNLAFAASHLVALGPPMLVIMVQLRENRAARHAAREAYAEQVPAEDYAFRPGQQPGGMGFFDMESSADVG